ncbi:hypothetical protein [Paraburkholderia silvatlantica]|uniref:Uncharacterized protein n=1 Tax=Paraburkholderia silvatlantica TaxID=321895 RepID=A0ABR6FVM4_9BURK|nr:hypothetical protein [Paraburkholderia silvatlantica]MBB2931127.1 hypothetical protein [Paraburkholderia silvatlantica]
MPNSSAGVSAFLSGFSAIESFFYRCSNGHRSNDSRNYSAAVLVARRGQQRAVTQNSARGLGRYDGWTRSGSIAVFALSAACRLA